MAAPCPATYDVSTSSGEVDTWTRGVRELKQQLSEYLDRAARGERIIVTDRGRPRATLGPLADGDHIARGVEEGWITPPADAGPPPPRTHRVRTEATIAEMLAEDRGE